MAITPRGASQTPANTTFVNMKTEVARFVKSPTSTEILGVAGDGINDAVRFMNTRVWAFMLNSEKITLVADSGEYDIDAKVKLPRHVELLNSNDRAKKKVPYLPTKDFLQTFPDRTATSGGPVAFTILNPYNYGQLVFNAPPDATYIATYPKIRLWYYELIQLLSGDSDTLTVPAEVERCIVWNAKQYIAELYGNARQISVAERRFKQAFEEIKKQHRREDTDWPSAGRFGLW